MSSILKTVIIVLVSAMALQAQAEEKCKETSTYVLGSYSCYDVGAGFRMIVITPDNQMYQSDDSQCPTSMPFSGCDKGKFLIQTYPVVNDFGVDCVSSIVSGTCYQNLQ